MRATLILFTLLAACQRTQAPTSTDAPAPTAGGGLYTLQITPASAKAGEAGESVVEIKPAAGYKMNQEFPTKMTLKPVKGLSFAKDTLTKAEADLTEKALRFKVSHTAQKAGTFEVPAVADFSVCNPEICKLFRGEALSWKVTAQ